MKHSFPTIIIADDDIDDKLLIQDALSENGISKEAIILTSDGDELLEVLREYNKPCIVFLDLNMPRKDGRQTLKEIKSDPFLRHIPVIIFTTSTSTDDVISSYKAGSNTYFTKPSTYSELVNVFHVIKSYWLERAILWTNN